MILRVLGFLIFALFGIGVIATLLGDALESVSLFPMELEFLRHSFGWF
jgi:hypothetical protein